MSNGNDAGLDALFAAARRERLDIAGNEAYFDTRVMVRILERKTGPMPLQQVIWRMIPGFAGIAVVVLACNFLFNPLRSIDPFAVIINGQEELMARNYLQGE